MKKYKKKLAGIAIKFNRLSEQHKYSQKFNWLGVKIVKLPTDLHVFQELIFKKKPKYIIETGIAHGGSLIFLASMQKLMNINGKVIGIDTNLRKKNEKIIKNHPLYKNNIILLNGSSTDINVVKKVKSITRNSNTMVILDSNHTEEHVCEELDIYSKIVSKKNYLIVQDTGIVHMPEKLNKDRLWTKKKNPYTAVKKFLKKNKNFKIDKDAYEKIYFSASPDGFLIKK